MNAGQSSQGGVKTGRSRNVVLHMDIDIFMNRVIKKKGHLKEDGKNTESGKDN